MTGQEIFNKHLKAAVDAGPGSEEWVYAQTLKTAFFLDSKRLYDLLEQAEKEGKKIGLELPIPPGDGPSEPTRAILI